MQRTVSILHLLIGLVCGAVALPFIQLAFFATGTPRDIAAAGQIFLILSLLFFWPSIGVGIWGLIHFRSARPALLAVGGLYLFLLPIGTILGVLTLIAIVGSKQTEPQASTERSRTIGLLLAMGATGSAIVLGLSLLFYLNHDPIPDELAMVIAPAAALLAICLPLLLRRIDRKGGNAITALPSQWRSERDWRRQESVRQELERQRIARLDSDPATARYAAALRRGEYWSDEAIEYDQDASLLVTAPAIRPIERAMRDAGIPLRRGLGATLTARCQIDPERLYALFPPRGRYHYADDFHFDRSYDPGEKVIISSEGTSYIHIVDLDPQTPLPVFPSLTST